ncbi:hypothetical protein PF001_g15135 [Phytophthora fragariae]|uniref:Uncharacterized protein n=1 Tax=Phytophthora fragariae TaxID=53985 RepID=A0A6A4D221_9STRA|nr:hypothetical protein PF001_g15135 [Phytophthora fragariae]
MSAVMRGSWSGNDQHFAISPPAPSTCPSSSAYRKGQFVILVALVGQDSTAMAPATRKNDHDAPAADGERQAELEAQLAQLRAEIVALQATSRAPRPPPTEPKPRVPSGLPKFKGKRDEDVRQWLF